MTRGAIWPKRPYVALFSGLLALTLGAAPVQAQTGAPVQPDPQLQSGGYTLDATVKPEQVRPGEKVIIEATVTATEASRGRHVDVLILDANNKKIAQEVYREQSFVPGQTRTYTWKWPAPANLAPGTYAVRVGVYSPELQRMAGWDHDAARFMVGSDPTPPLQSGGYTLDAKVKPEQVKAGEEVTIEATVTATEASRGRHVDLLILDANNKKIAQEIHRGQSFTPGQTRTYTWKWRAPANLATGIYTVKIGIYSPELQQMAAWDYRGARFTVGRP